MPYDVFISHAFEDKHTVAIPLSDYLTERGLSVWLDADEITLGDSLRSAIDRGLREARFGVVILSPAFFSKGWPLGELEGLFARERRAHSKVILPVWHIVGGDEVEDFSPMLAGRLSVSTSDGIAAVGDAVLRAVRPGEKLAAPRPSAARKDREEAVTSLRQRLLAASGSADIGRVVFELQAHLHRYPQDVDARLLLKTAERALGVEELRPRADYFLMRRLYLFRYLASFIGLLGLGFGIYRLIRWLLSLF